MPKVSLLCRGREVKRTSRGMPRARSRWGFVGILACIQVGAQAALGDPEEIADAQVARSIKASLVIPGNATETDRARMYEARDWIARANLVMMNRNISVDRLKKLFQWEGLDAPLFAPGVTPLSGYHVGQEAYVINRTENWRVWPDHTLSIDVVWVPVGDPDKPFFKESQRYRQANEVWVLYQQERTKFSVCRGDPRCIPWPK